MSVQMIGRELDEIVRELYVLPPADFVTARNELVRQARAAGSPDVAERLQQLRRPTRSAWLVNLLASDPAAMQRLSALGRELRDAQTGLVRTELRSLAEQRRQLIADLMDRAKAHAAAAGLRLTPTVLSEGRRHYRPHLSILRVLSPSAMAVWCDRSRTAASGRCPAVLHSPGRLATSGLL